MSRISMRYAACVLLAAPLLVTAPIAQAQPAAQLRNANLDLSAVKKLNPQQLSQLKTIGRRYDLKLMAGFKGKEALKATMEGELRAIDKETDPAKKDALIKAYQAKNMSGFKTIMRDSQVDVTAMAREMGAAAPDLDFRVVDGVSVIAVAKLKTDGGKSASKSAPAAAATPSRRVKALTSADYTVEKDLGCGGISGNEIVVSGGYMRNSSWAAEAGGCENEGVYVHPFTVAAGEQTRIDMTMGLEGKVSAVGIIAMSWSAAGAEANIVTGNNRRVDEADAAEPFHAPNTYCYALAMYLWATSETCGVDNARLSTVVTKPGTYAIRVRSHTDSMAGGVVASTTAESRIKQLRTTLTTEPK